ncbi:restriction endonuclease, partial [Listeria monocytogenes]|nr:restriction endonuclease [Listeria monocytogenes]
MTNIEEKIRDLAKKYETNLDNKVK